MNNDRIAKHWKVVEIQIRQAAEFLNEPERFSILDNELEFYRSYIDSNELELAMDELAAIAREFGCKPGFWRRLEKPATQMGLVAKAAEYEREFHDALARNT